MGIKHINSFLEKYLGSSLDIYFSYKEIMKENGITTIAIDMNLYYYKFIKSRMKNPYSGFLNQIIRMKEYNIRPLYIMDGKAPVQKDSIINKRKCTKSYEYIDYKMIKKFFDVMNVDYIHSPVESDSYIGFLYQKGLIDYCLSEDFDTVLFGCNKMLSIDKGKIKLYDIEKILSSIGMCFEYFLYFCILLGSDYNQKIYKIHYSDLYNIFKSIGPDIDKILHYLNNNHYIFSQASRDSIKDIIKRSYDLYTYSDAALSNTLDSYDFNRHKRFVSCILWDELNKIECDMVKSIDRSRVNLYVHINNNQK